MFSYENYKMNSLEISAAILILSTFLLLLFDTLKSCVQEDEVGPLLNHMCVRWHILQTRESRHPCPGNVAASY